MYLVLDPPKDFNQGGPGGWVDEKLKTTKLDCY